jgi:aminoglycoside phosphotransferase (APT) family kinase protein
VPEPVAVGEPGEGYPFRWAVYRWIPGTVVDAGGPVTASGRLVDDLVTLIAALRDLPVAGAPVQPSRRTLHDHDPGVRLALRHMGDGAAAAERAWDAALGLPGHDGPPTWVHGDLFGPNVLVADGRIAGVLDWGCTGLGDPACDLALALVPLAGAARDQLRRDLAIDDLLWARARGWVLRTAITGIPYYRRTNPGFVTRARRNLDAALSG